MDPETEILLQVARYRWKGSDRPGNDYQANSIPVNGWHPKFPGK